MSMIERVAILGAGAGGVAAAAGLTIKGYHVSLYNRTLERIKPIMDRGGVELVGSLGEQFVNIPTITTDISEAMKHAQLIATAVPANGQRVMIETCLPHLQSDQIVLLMTGCAGSLEMAQLFKSADLNLDETLLGECVVVPYSARMVGPARIRVKLTSDTKPKRMRASSFPGRNTPRMIEMLGDMFHLLPKPNVLDPGLNNPNFLIHPAPMLTNYAAVERADGRLSLMNEGMTAGTLRALDAVDAEKMALQNALGLEVVSIDDFYRETRVGPQVYRSPGEPFGLRDKIHRRYITEDVPFGMVLYSSLGKLLRVPTPVCDSIISIFSILEQTDFWAQGRTTERLGIDGMRVDQLKHYLETGEKLKQE